MRTIVVVLAVLAIAAGAGCSDAGDPPASDDASSSEPPVGEPAPEGIEGVVAVSGLTNGHTEDPVEYPTYPPMGGDHFPRWITCGFYDVALPDEAAVHSLEHGAIWIAYQPSVGADELAVVQGLAAADGHILASPYSDLRAPFVLTAWERQLDVQSISDPRVQAFISAYVRAGAAPEPDVTCAGGIEPIP